MSKFISLLKIGLFSTLVVTPAFSFSAESKSLVEIASQQDKVLISGVVKDDTGQTIIGARVVIQGTTTGTLTNIDGEYSLSIPVGAIAEVSYIGHDTVVFTVTGSKTKYDISLNNAGHLLDEVVVTGYGGKQLRSELTTSIASVGAEKFEAGIYENPADVLKGTVPGLSVVSTSANPRSAPSVTLRGGTEFDGTGTPLYIIDGQVRDHMHYLNPDDIADIQVLKDAGSTAIYGARANNGVILVTTKKGSKGSSSIRFAASTTIKTFQPTYDMLDAGGYLHWFRSGMANAGQMYQDSKGDWKGFANMSDLGKALAYGTGNKYFDASGNPIDGNKSGLGVWSPMILTPELEFLKGEGWQTMIDPVYGDEIIYSDFDLGMYNIDTPTISQNYSVNMSGANESGSYYASIAYLNDNGVIPDNFVKRLNFTFNGDYQINNWLKSYSGLKFTNSDENGLPPTQSSEANYFRRLFSVPPTMRKYNPDGDLIVGTHSGDGNQRVNLENFERSNERTIFDLNQSFEITFTEDLSMKVNGSWLYDYNTVQAFNKDYIQKPGVVIQSRNSSVNYDKILSQVYNAHINYDKKIGDHAFSAMVGGEMFEKTIFGLDASGSGAPTDDFADLGLTSSDEGKRNINTNNSQERIMSLIGRATYNYKSKYLVDFVARYDGYSKLVGDNQFGFFPGVSGGWVFGREDFMKPFDHVISFAKLRTSYGVNGNTSKLGAYQLQGSYGSVRYNGDVGFGISGIPNPYLKWEKSHTFDFGLDMSFFQNLVNLDITYYNRVTKDKHADIPLSSSSGISTIKTNNGELQNRGIEVGVKIRVIDKGDWKWNVNVNTAHNKNKILTLPDNGIDNNRQGGTQIYVPGTTTDEKMWVGGYQQGQIYGNRTAYQFDGVYATWEDIPENLTVAAYAWGKPSYSPDLWAKMSDAEKSKGFPIKPGDAKWRDVNGDGIVDRFDQVDTGNYTPKWQGGISSDLRYKNFALNLRMDFSFGGKINDIASGQLMAGAQGMFSTIDLVKESWTPENPNAEYPEFRRADQLGTNNYFRTTTQFIYDVNYIAFREVGVNYTLPQTVLNKLKMQNASVMFTVRNLGYIMNEDAKNLYSPESIDKNKNSNGGYALPLTLSVGLNFTF